MVMIYRVFYTKEDKTGIQNIIILNLALSDILASVYLAVLIGIDRIYMGIFVIVAWEWRKTIACKFVAMVSSTSANMSLYLVTLLTVYRSINIASEQKISPKVVLLSLGIGWIFCICTALMPVLDNIPYVTTNIQSDACLLFNFTSNNYQGWQYGLVFFILTNFLLLLVMLVSYCFLVGYVRKSSKVIRGSSDTQVSGRRKSHATSLIVFLLVISNMLVWLPVLVLSSLTLMSVEIPSKTSR